MNKNQPQRLIVGISGASGIVYGIETLKLLKQAGIETHLIVSKAALQTLKHESTLGYDELKALADVHYSNNDIGASVASGSKRNALTCWSSAKHA